MQRARLALQCVKPLRTEVKIIIKNLDGLVQIINWKSVLEIQHLKSYGL